MATLEDLTGQKFGRLTVTGPYYREKKKTVWPCRCDCGVTVDIPASNLKVGNTKSCGCFRRDFTTARNTTHGLGRPPEYRVWAGMRSRCEDPNSKAWENYGGRGIKVCDRWQSFESFYADMGSRPSDDHQIDRIDNEAGYGPDNCRWATRIENSSNRRNTVYVEWRGETDTIPGWARRIGMSEAVLWMRIQRLGWDIERAMTAPIRPSGRRKKQDHGRMSQAA